MSTAAASHAAGTPRSVLPARTRSLLRVLTPGLTEDHDRRAALCRALEGATPDRVWLTMAVLTGELPTASDVLALTRSSRLDGPEVIVQAAEQWLRSGRGDTSAPVVIAHDQTVVDVYQTARLPRATGIQRVARQLVRHWHAAREIRLVAWNDAHTALIDLNLDETERLLGDGSQPDPDDTVRTIVVPYGGEYFLPELAIGMNIAPRIQALAQYAACHTGVIGFDCVPLTSPETTAPGTPSHFAGNLAAVRHMDQVVAISEAAATEYRGWRTMLGATGLSGPRIDAVMLPVDVPTVDRELIEHVRVRYEIGDLPLVLVVGTHEARKNHEAVLHAAQLLWRRGREFSLLFVGALGWRSGHFDATFQALRATGMPLENATDVDDHVLGCLYRLAHCTVFPSLNEGFGLPVAESLAAGTPVVTSNIGSMAEIAAGGGALTVDPRDDDALAQAWDTLLTDPSVHDRLTREARQRPQSTWADYADRVWNTLHTDA